MNHQSASVVRSLIVAGGIIGVALGLTFAQSRGWISEEFTTRGVMITIGLVMTAYANVAPKTAVPASVPIEAQAAVQAARRVAGWCLTLGGVAWIALWLFAPREVAQWASVAVVMAGLAVTIAFGVRAWTRVRAAMGQG